MTPQRLQELLNAFVDETLDAPGQRELARALETDEEARRAFVRATDQHQALRDLLGHAVAKQPTSWKRWTVLIAVAAVVLIALSVWVLSPQTPAPQDDSVVHRTPKPVQPTPKPAPPPVPKPDPQEASTPPKPEPPAPKPETLPDPKPPPPPPTPPEPKPPAPKPEPPAPPVPPPAPKPEPPPTVTVIAVATIETSRGEAFLVTPAGRKPAKAGLVIGAGHGVATGSGESSVVLVFPDATRVELRSGTVIEAISATAGKHVLLGQGSLMADVADQPAGQPMVFATRTAEALVQGTKLGLSAFEGTRLEVKEGKVRFTRLEDKRTVTVGPGQGSLAAKGSDMTPKKVTRGYMMPGAAVWGEDFQDADEIERDWLLTSTGPTSGLKGHLDVDCSADGELNCSVRDSFKAPYRVSVDVEFNQRIKGVLVALRFQAWKGKDLVHIDVDDEFYYLRIGTQNLTLEAPHRPRRERWTVELGADGTVQFLIEGKVVMKGKRPGTNEDYHITLMTRVKDALPGTHVRFDNFVIERLK